MPSRGSQNFHLYARQLHEMPDYSNPATKEAKARVGKFNFDLYAPPENCKPSVKRGPYELDNESIYEGEWAEDGLRCGRGV